MMRRLIPVLAAVAVGWCGMPARALTADELLLVVNKNVPEGRVVAERYAKVRGVPEGRIVELAVTPGEEISFDDYERGVVPPVRRFIEENGLKGKVKCLVTCYGVPLKIGKRELTAEENKETTELGREIYRIKIGIEPVVGEMEKIAKELDPTFTPDVQGAGLGDVSRRADRAGGIIEKRLPEITDAGKREEKLKSVLKVVEQLGGPTAVTVFLARRDLADPNLPAAEREKWTTFLQVIGRQKKEYAGLMAARYDRMAREKVRDLAKRDYGLVEYAGVVQSQLEYLKPGESGASLDNELALLWWTYYPRAMWMPNPLHHGAGRVAGIPPVMMVSRLDGPDVATVEAMLAGTLQAEQRGLSGKVVVDSRGLPQTADPKAQGYWMFDERLRRLAAMVRAAGTMPLVHDDAPDVISTSPVNDIALYCGWYSVAKYVSPGTFKPGAVGYHVASYELTTLKLAGTGAWVPNLLRAGVAASVGPVAEPYLTAFPAPEEFFPLLMTGKLTLAEVYWRTTPMTSWQMALIGDPLYRPFEKKPAMGVERLTGTLREAAVEGSVSQ